MLLDIEGWVLAAGYPGLAAIIFAETGLLLGVFLPGDSLLLSAGFLAQRGHLSVWLLIPLLVLAAVVGDAVGYAIGRRWGPQLFRKEEGRFFRRAHLDRAVMFYDRHGGKTIAIARFVGFIRTFAPTIAGAAGMRYPRFFAFNLLGGAIWVTSLVGVGYLLGGQVESLELYMTALFGGALLLSSVPVGWQALRRRRLRAASAAPS